jgi:hypothetical protein
MRMSLGGADWEQSEARFPVREAHRIGRHALSSSRRRRPRSTPRSPCQAALDADLASLSIQSDLRRHGRAASWSFAIRWSRSTIDLRWSRAAFGRKCPLWTLPGRCPPVRAGSPAVRAGVREPAAKPGQRPGPAAGPVKGWGSPRRLAPQRSSAITLRTSANAAALGQPGLASSAVVASCHRRHGVETGYCAGRRGGSCRCCSR